ncbi:SDR family oxidoreductase [Glutamicibacter sp. JL.03c]|uniref:SDR family NAD(P)-dependent oxidoreductase n=1 Tax=Glutamicibacter sp. JL.03c TaxID=2984842 RepID=UPI0021F6EAA1|nr:SDR family NAD(P)-dependent oxidoreductase [Glutamicibacter sp. JL.03c]UYQ77296.1 SDR family oxidoreductase [Glutamicibacter sp. JL.03c]
MILENIETYGARRFEGKTALVTGGAGGIGAAICARLAVEGATVVIADTNREAAETLQNELRAAGYQAATAVFNLTDAEACASAIEEVVAEHSQIDVLVNNAGINRRGPLLELSDEDWDLSFAVNLDSLYRLSKLVVPLMQAQGGGSIVNTASQWGISPAPGHIAYNVTKAAVVSFTKNLARDYAPDKIRVNAIAPGEVLTPMVEANLARTGRSVEDLDSLVPFGRVGRPHEIAALVAFLASDEAPYLCGSVVEITGAQAVA